MNELNAKQLNERRTGARLRDSQSFRILPVKHFVGASGSIDLQYPSSPR